jgi:uncharacterized membrane protein YkoI
MRHATFATAAALVLTFAAGQASAQATKAPARKPAAAKHETQAALRAQAKITEADARQTALTEVPNGKVAQHELEREDGKLIYSYDIKVAGKRGVEEVHVDAVTGEMIKHEHEDPATEAKEKKAEAKEKAAKKP